jgi:hypothetical protein
MRRTSCAISVLLCAAFAWPGWASAGPSLLGEARSVSLMTGVAKFCPQVMAIDHDLAERYAEVFRTVGRRTGGLAWDGILTAEAKRRFQEIRITGVPAWCAAQRSSLRELGAGAIFR